MISSIFKYRIDHTHDNNVLFLEANILIRLIQEGLQRQDILQVNENIEKLDYIIKKLIT